MKNIFIYVFLIHSYTLFSQASTNAPLWDDNHHIIERLEISTSNFKDVHSSIRPLWRRDLHEWKKYADTTFKTSNKIQDAELRYLANDNNEYDTSIQSRKPFLKVFYRTPAHLFELKNVKNFYFNIDPILHFKAGLELNNKGETNFLFLNRRGVTIRGNIANRLFFYTDIIETQGRFATYMIDRINAESAIPGAGFYKQYDSRFTPQPNDGFDYLLAQGYIGFNIIPQVGIQLGHGKNFVGDGHRSLFLSDFSNNQFYLKINTRVWRIHYQNLYMELTQDYKRGGDKILPKKYMAAHYLSINVLKNLNIGLWEATIFSRGKGFEFQYLNPLIFYRALEQALGSPDNVVIGLSWKYNFLKRFSFYGQIVLDEFSSHYLFPKTKAERGWWANKNGVQLGLKYINVAGVKGLDLQLEYNTVRPYTYSFRDSTASYTHYNQPLAHPLGANFFEWIGIIRYQPLPNLTLRAQVNGAIYGLDTLTNWGSNVHLSYNTFQQEFGNKTGQGIHTTLLIADFWLSYQIRHNIYLELQYRYRRQNSDWDAYDNTSHIFSLGLRWNISEQLNDF